MDKRDFDFDSEDSPYRKCELCEIQYHEEYGSTCDECDIWICKNCEKEHIQNGHKL